MIVFLETIEKGTVHVLLLPGEEDVMQFLVNAYADTGENVMKCTLCGKFSKQRSNMRRHMILMHTKPTTNVCKYCQKQFKHKYYLQEHIRSRVCLSRMLFDAPT